MPTDYWLLTTDWAACYCFISWFVFFEWMRNWRNLKNYREQIEELWEGRAPIKFWGWNLFLGLHFLFARGDFPTSQKTPRFQASLSSWSHCLRSLVKGLKYSNLWLFLNGKKAKQSMRSPLVLSWHFGLWSSRPAFYLSLSRSFDFRGASVIHLGHGLWMKECRVCCQEFRVVFRRFLEIKKFFVNLLFLFAWNRGVVATFPFPFLKIAKLSYVLLISDSE